MNEEGSEEVFMKAQKKETDVNEAIRDLKDVSSQTQKKVQQNMGETFREVRSEAEHGLTRLGHAVKNAGTSAASEVVDLSSRAVESANQKVKQRPFRFLAGAALTALFTGFIFGRFRRTRTQGAQK